jgi:lipopolysaccharide transport system permease protein
LIVSGVAVLNSGLLLVCILLIFVILGFYPGLNLAWLPMIVLLNLGMALGFGLVLGVLNTFIRDVGQVVPVILQFLFWLSPIVYSKHMIPEAYRDLLMINPIYHVVEAYHDVMVYNQAPDLRSLLIIVSLIAISFIVAMKMYRRASVEMADVL